MSVKSRGTVTARRRYSTECRIFSYMARHGHGKARSYENCSVSRFLNVAYYFGTNIDDVLTDRFLFLPRPSLSRAISTIRGRGGSETSQRKNPTATSQ